MFSFTLLMCMRACVRDHTVVPARDHASAPSERTRAQLSNIRVSVLVYTLRVL